jgi:ATP-dependent DNA helicase PIF1
MTQSQALSILKTGANVFLTGEPGSGKTHIVNSYVDYLRKYGIAATHIGGMTIHSWSGIGIKRTLNKYDLDRISSSEYVAKRIRRSHILIIEEVSMLSDETVSMIEAVCREVRQSPEPFGGLQVVFVGDFFQLPPIIKRDTESLGDTLFEDESGYRFAYSSSAWERANPVVCYLTEQHRQDDDGFLSVLSAIRQNFFGEEHMMYIEARKAEIAKVPEGAPKLFSHNADVDRINAEMLKKISGEARVFEMTSGGNKKVAESLKKGCLSPERLLLKVEAKVMFTKNNPREKFVNGTLGEVVEFDKATRYPIVRTRGGLRIVVKPMEWTVEDGGKVSARINQLPLRLAWAITVHKSQGMNLDEAVMDLRDVFEYGQGYVALSRVRRLSGLYMIGWNERTFEVNPEVLSKDESFREASEEAERAFGKLSSEELEKLRENFVKACGGKKVPVKEKSVGKTGFDKIRETYPNAYRSWDKAQDEKLKELYSDGVTPKELVKEFGRKVGAINSRLIKLGLVEEDGG